MRPVVQCSSHTGYGGCVPGYYIDGRHAEPRLEMAVDRSPPPPMNMRHTALELEPTLAHVAPGALSPEYSGYHRCGAALQFTFRLARRCNPTAAQLLIIHMPPLSLPFCSSLSSSSHSLSGGVGRLTCDRCDSDWNYG